MAAQHLADAAVTMMPLLFLLLTSLLFSPSTADPQGDKQALLDFISGIQGKGRPLNWNATGPVCGTWVGVTCSADNSRVTELRLPGVGLSGPIPPSTLGRLTALQTLSLRNNGLRGPFPTNEFANLTALTDLHLQFNAFSGPLPEDYSAWPAVTAIDLSFNRLNGSIPPSIANLTQLAGLNLANNSLSGPVPTELAKLNNLATLNLSNNDLTGAVPSQLLLRFPNSSFAGNSRLTFPPLSPSKPPNVPLTPPSPNNLIPPTSQTPSATGDESKKISESLLLGIIVGGCALAFLAAALFLVLCCSKRSSSSDIPSSSSSTTKKLAKPKPSGGGFSDPEKAISAKQDENNRLVFFDECSFAFDLEDLLHASAEVLGKGVFGTAYKAVLEDSTTVVVKRLKDVAAGKKEFEQQMAVVGGIRHENVADLRAYYFSKDEKLLVYDYFSFGSVASMLHGRHGEGKTPLDWDTRVRIALGAAKGIAHIHTLNGGKLIHGNVKASNVFLNQTLYGCVSDVGLATLMNQSPSVSRTAGYRAPEAAHDTRKATQMSDVYSFGVLLLELLTGKSPIQVTGGGDEFIHLVRWVHSVVREEWTAEVFDVELMKYPNIEEELVGMLQIAMSCVSRTPEKRLKMEEVVKAVEELRRPDTGTRPSSEVYSEESTPPAQQGVGSLSVEASSSSMK